MLQILFKSLSLHSLWQVWLTTTRLPHLLLPQKGKPNLDNHCLHCPPTSLMACLCSPYVLIFELLPFTSSSLICKTDLQFVLGTTQVAQIKSECMRLSDRGTEYEFVTVWGNDFSVVKCPYAQLESHQNCQIILLLKVQLK